MYINGTGLGGVEMTDTPEFDAIQTDEKTSNLAYPSLSFSSSEILMKQRKLLNPNANSYHWLCRDPDFS